MELIQQLFALGIDFIVIIVPGLLAIYGASKASKDEKLQAR
jgi:hypothetical protein